ncbi:MAG: oxidoreductase [Leptospiraceae bacterium]|nr:MAG: oxidoreductase [Leptospiraceae bacterium]
MNIKNQNILITGGASGIGKLMAIGMAKKGAKNIVIWDVNEENLNQMREEWEKDNHFRSTNLITQFCDLTDKEMVYDLAKKVLKELGTIDILVNNAGIVSGKSFLEISDEQIIRTFQVNVLAHFWTIRAFLPKMIENKNGFIVNIVSAAGLIGVYKQSDYGASKFAAFGFDESLRMEIQRNKWPVRNLVVCPYYINTGMFDGVKTRWPWILPILDQHKVVKKIIKAIEKNKKRLYMPWIVYLLPILRLFPVWFFDFFINLLGVNHTMDEFKGRTKPEDVDLNKKKHEKLNQQKLAV